MRPSYVDPTACALSSMTARLCFRAIAISGFMSAIRPVRCTGMIALVRGVTAASTAAGSMFWSGSTSAKIGVAPTATIAAVEATNEFGGVITSSPGPMSSDLAWPGSARRCRN